MGFEDLIAIAAIVILGVLLSVVMRRIREPLLEVASPLAPEEALAALREALPRAGYVIDGSHDGPNSLAIQARIRCFNLFLYWVWADRILLQVTSAPNAVGSRVIATCKPAPHIPHVRRSHPLYTNKDRIRDALVQSLRGTVVKESSLAT
jgi:hypothetical protein